MQSSIDCGQASLMRARYRNLDHSRPLDVHRWSEHPEVHNLIEKLWDNHFSDFSRDTGRPGRRPLGDPKRQLMTLVLDLYLAWSTDPDLSLGVHMSRGGYRVGGRYNELHISPIMIELVHRARNVGLIGMHLGSEAAGRITRIWPEIPLIAMYHDALFGVHDIVSHPDRETIVLSRCRDGRKLPTAHSRHLEYSDTPEIAAMREQVQRYNSLIDRTFVDIPTLDHPRILRPSRASNELDSYVWLDQNNKYSRRIFYRGNWALGGRFHGGFWQQLPEYYRSQLYLNDLPVVEDDYRGTHVALLYGMEGRPLREDPYSLNIASEYSALQMRKWVKSLVLIAINARSETSAFNAFRQGEPTGSPGKRFTNAQLKLLLEEFKRQHPAIAIYLCSDKGVELMAIDGRITARIIDQFTKDSIPVLTVFDSYLIAGKYASDLRSAMKVAMDREVPGASTNYDRAGVPFDYATAHTDQITGMRTMHPADRNREPMTLGYLSRLHAFRSR